MANIFGNIFGFIIFARFLIPAIYLTDYIFRSDEYFGVAAAVLLSISMIFFACSSSIIYCMKNSITPHLSPTNDRSKYVILLCVLLIFNISLPAFQGLGSEALNNLYNTNKVQAWIGFCLLELCYLQFILAAVFATSKKGVLGNLLCAICIGLLSMSKVIVLAVAFKYLTARLLVGQRSSNKGFFVFIALGIVAVGLLLQVTSGQLSQLGALELVVQVTEVFFYSSNFLYILMFERGGIELLSEYRTVNELDYYGGLKYFLNPLFAVFGMGLNSSIGPFLNYELFGSVDSRGVNPTLFWEVAAVYGILVASAVTPIITILIVVIATWLMRESLRRRSRFEMALIMQLGFYTLTMFADSLYAIRSIIPLIVLLIGFQLVRKRNVSNA